MASKTSMTFSINGNAKWLGVLALSLALAACGGGGGKKGGNRAVVGDDPDNTEEPGTGVAKGIDGRWEVSYTMKDSPCYEAFSFKEEWDAKQTGNKVTFKDAEGEVRIEGELSGNILNFSEDNSDENGTSLSDITLVFEDTTFSGEETITCQPKGGGESESGKAQYSGTKIGGTVPTQPGTPTTPESPGKPGTPTTPEAPGTSPGGAASDDEPNNAPGQENPISAGDTVKGTVNTITDEMDFFILTTSKSVSYQVSLTNFDGNNLDLGVFQVVDGDVQFLGASESGPGIDEAVSFAGADAVQSKVYILVLATDTAATTSDYTLKVTRK